MAYRHAIYVAPAQGSELMRLANRWLGRNAYKDKPRPQPDVEGIADITAAPRRYGFHGTLVAPFRLHESRSVDELRSALSRFAVETGTLDLPLRVGRLGPFFALVPREPSPALDALAENAVRRFHPFRAEPSDEEIARRKPASLTPRQRELLAHWHYPYVMDEFRYHMTLTGPVAESERDGVEEALNAHFPAATLETFVLDGIARYAEPKPDSNFRIRERFALNAAHEATA